jgi:aminoglycoside phosphotransferase family enzyme/predicted kinase
MVAVVTVGWEGQKSLRNDGEGAHAVGVAEAPRPQPPTSPPAAVVETHISTLFFVDDRVYKRKRPVQLPFIDLRDRSAREALCHREVELNRRLAPDVYLGVADVTGPDGEPCDHLVVMRRLPPDRRLSTIVSRRDPGADQLVAAVARQVAAFHRNATRSTDIAAAGTVASVLCRWVEIVEEIRASAHAPDVERVGHVLELVEQYCAGRHPLFETRLLDWCICDGHGDIQADDVFCLDDGPRILDCVEFDDRLRAVDVADDVAFLAMDLERLGRIDLSRHFVRQYEQAADARLPPSLVDFYVSYRAMVRCMVACTRADQTRNRASEPDVERARQLLQLGHERVRAALPRLVLVGGLPGTGKTTVAATAAERLADARVLRSDVVRKELAGLDAEQSAVSPLGTGLYTASVTDRVYEELAVRARIELSMGRTVLVDASFHAASHRRLLRQVAAETSSPVVELRCVVDAVEAARRIRHRRAEEHDASDATPAVAAAMAETFERWGTASELDTCAPDDDVVEAALRSIDAAAR